MTRKMITIPLTLVRSVHNKLQSNNGNSKYIVNAKAQLTTIARKAFIDLFVIRTPVFVLAVMDSAVANRSIATQIDKFESNIAKFSVNELAKNMRNLEINFQILQVSKVADFDKATRWA